MRGRVAAADVSTVLEMLKKKATKKTVEGMARYGIPSAKAWGVSVAGLQQIAKQIGKNHALTEGLWATDVYEARMLCAYVGEAEALTVEQMDRWCSSFDSWSITDTLCFHLFDRSPHALGRIHAWAGSDEEFVKRAAFALLASFVLHGRGTQDELLATLPLVEQAAPDERHLVTKGISWGFRALARQHKAMPTLHAAVRALAEKLAASAAKPAATIGKETLRELRETGARAASVNGRKTAVGRKKAKKKAKNSE